MKSAWRQFDVGSKSVGNRYDIEIGTDRLVHPLASDGYPNDFEARVIIHDHVTGETWERKGHGKYIGNFSPIWVNFKGKSVTVESLLLEKASL